MGLKKLLRKHGEWEIQVLVTASLLLQMILFFSGGRRKRTNHWFLRLVLWLAYLLADYVAIYTLGHLSQKDKLSDEEMHLHVFWAPFLILHLGGQDTVTAFAVEDNELWLRHFLSLVSQVFLAGYVYRKSHPGIRLMRPAIVMFVAGVVKYGERVLALRAASMGCLRSSMLTPPDPGPNYAKFVEECQSRRFAGLVAEIVNVPERPPDDDDNGDGGHVEAASRGAYGDLVYNAHRFHRIFRRLFVDLILSFQDRTDSLAFFRKLDRDKAFKVVEVELMLMYESLHTKALVIHHKWLGLALRLYTLSSAVVSLVLFLRAAGDIEHYDHRRVDVVISYMLLAGAILLELCALALVIVSPWTYAYLRGTGGTRCQLVSSVVFSFISHRPFYPEKSGTWSNKVPQYNLIRYCLEDEPGWCKMVMEQLEWKYNFGVKTLWDYLVYTDDIEVTDQLKRFMFLQIKSKADSVTDPKNYRKLGDHRGQWALQRKGLYHALGWSVDCEFDESILLWHIATDLCLYDSKGATTGGTGEKVKYCGCSCSCLSMCFRCFRCSCFGLCPDNHRPHGLDDSGTLAKTSREISNYMVFLLVMLPFMMPAGIGQIRFRDTCAEAKNFFRRDGEVRDAESCAEELKEVDTSIAEPRDVKGDRSNSVLFQACKLAKELLKLEDDHTRWSLIAGVWAEMLCYAAGKCRGASHARQLSQGGQLLTVVWLLMAHFGVGEQYRVESGHVRAKLIVVDK